MSLEITVRHGRRYPEKILTASYQIRSALKLKHGF